MRKARERVTLFCNNCGEQITDDALICVWCGKVVLSASARNADPTTIHVSDIEGMRTREDIPGLIRALGSKDRNVCWRAAKALGALGDPKAVQPLVSMMGNSTLGCSPAAIEALKKIGNPGVEVLVSALADPNKNVREAALTVLDEVGWEPDSLEHGAAYWMAKGKWERCVDIGEPALGPLSRFIDWGRRNDQRNWKEAVIALGRIGARSRDPLVRTEIAGMLISIMRDEHMRFHGNEPPSLDMDGFAHKGYWWDWRPACITALCEMGDSSVIESLVRLLDDGDGAVRKYASDALERLGWKKV